MSSTDSGKAQGQTSQMRLTAWVLLATCFVIIILWVQGVYVLLADPSYEGEALDNDFSVFWAAAQLANEGRWVEPFDIQTLNLARQVPPEDTEFSMVWFYPPAYLLLVYPLGLLDYFWAWIVFGAISVSFFALAIHGPAKAVPGALLFIVCAPVTMLVLSLGQNSLVFCGLLILALEAMRRNQPILAGLALAAMTMKPQLGLAIPLALAISGYWRTILWAFVFTAAIVLATLAFPGPSYWEAFFNGLVSGSEHLRYGGIEALMISAYGNSIVACLPPDLALNIQVVFSLLSLAAVMWIWTQPTSFDIKAAGLCFGLLMVTPYAIYYELVFALCGALYLARSGFGKTRMEASLLIGLWATPVLGTLTLPRPGFGFVAGLLAVCIGVTMYRARRVRTA